MGRGGFEPPKAEPADLQSDPVDRLGTYPIKEGILSCLRDLNPQPADYKSAALPIELRQQNLPSSVKIYSFWSIKICLKDTFFSFLQLKTHPQKYSSENIIG